MLTRLSYAVVALFLFLVVLCWWVIFAHAEDFRLTAYTLHCWPQPGYRVTATLSGLIYGDGGRRPIRLQASCDNGLSLGPWPIVPWSHGNITQLDMRAVVTLADTAGTVVATGVCTWKHSNGFLSARCQADELLGGAVDSLVSIAKEPS